MYQFYFKHFLCSLLFVISIFSGYNSSAQNLAHASQRDRLDLVSNVQNVRTDHSRIESTKKLIESSQEAGNKKAEKIHKARLALDKKKLKADLRHAKTEECSYLEHKSGKIKSLKRQLKMHEEMYSQVRKKIRKDLAKKNDFSLQKDAADLLKAVQARNETSTELAMEKSDLLGTKEALKAEWKKVKFTEKQLPANRDDAAENNLSNTK